jgi:hypothetical protein
MTNARFDALFGGLPRRPEAQLEQKHMDLAASVQAVVEEVVLRLTRSLSKEGERNLCLAGGVALNCVANGRVLREGSFESIWVQPAAGDAGGALGAALAIYHLHLGKPRRVSNTPDGMLGGYLGPEFAQQDIEARLVAVGARFSVLPRARLPDRHGDRPFVTGRRPIAAQFRLAIQGDQHHRILDPVAHVAVSVPAGLSLYSAWWKSKRTGAPLRQSDDNHAARGIMARRRMGVRRLGWAAWPLPRRQSSAANTPPGTS